MMMSIEKSRQKALLTALLATALLLPSIAPAYAASPQTFSISPGQRWTSQAISLNAGDTLNANITWSLCTNSEFAFTPQLPIGVSDAGNATVLTAYANILYPCKPGWQSLTYRAQEAGSYYVWVHNPANYTNAYGLETFGVINGTLNYTIKAAPASTTTSTTTRSQTITTTSTPSGQTSQSNTTSGTINLPASELIGSLKVDLKQGQVLSFGYTLKGDCQGSSSCGWSAPIITPPGKTSLVGPFLNVTVGSNLVISLKEIKPDGSFTFTANQTGTYILTFDMGWYYITQDYYVGGTLSYSYSVLSAPVTLTVVNQALNSTHAYRLEKGSTFNLAAPSKQYYNFNGWVGTGPGSYSGPAQNATITLNGDITETARYSYDQGGATWGYIIDQVPTIQALVFDVATIALISLILLKAVDIDPFQGKHLASILTLFATLQIAGFPFFYLSSAPAGGGAPGSLGPLPLAFTWTGSWVLGDNLWYTFTSVPAFITSLQLDSAAFSLIIASVLFRKASKKQTLEPQPPHNPSHRLLTGIYALLAFLWLNGSLGPNPYTILIGAMHLLPVFGGSVVNGVYSPNYFPTIAVDLAFGMIIVAVAIPAYFFTKPATPMDLTMIKPSRKVIAAIFPLAALAFYFSPSFTLPSLPAETNVYGLSVPVLTSIVSIGLIVWRRRWLRQNGLALAAFICAWFSIVLLFFEGGMGEASGLSALFPFFIFLSLPILAIQYRHIQSKTGLALGFIMSLFGLLQIIFYLYAVYELVFNIKGLPSLSAPRSYKVTGTKEDLEKEAKDETSE